VSEPTIFDEWTLNWELLRTKLVSRKVSSWSRNRCIQVKGDSGKALGTQACDSGAALFVSHILFQGLVCILGQGKRLLVGDTPVITCPIPTNSEFFTTLPTANVKNRRKKNQVQ